MKKCLKRVLVLTSCFSLLHSVAGLAAVVEAGQQVQETASETTVQAADEIDLSAAIPNEVVSITKKSKPYNVIYNYNGISVTLVDYYLTNDTLYMDVIVNNTTDKNCYIDAVDPSLNGISCKSASYITAYANRCSEDYIAFYLSSETSRYMDIANISDIAFSLDVYDEDYYYNYYYSYYYDEYDENYNPSANPGFYYTTPTIHFKDYTVSPSESLSAGRVLYHANGLKIVKKDLFVRNYGDSDVHLVLYLENTSDQTIYLTNDYCLLNGYSVTSDFGGLLNAGQTGIFHMTIPESELKGLNIHKDSDIKKFEGAFSFYVGVDYYSYYYGSSSSSSDRIRTSTINFMK